MLPSSQELDSFLLDLAWSLWTELGVAGVTRKHQNFLITIEELLILTSALAKIDPRLRDESLDWCSQYHHFISTHRLKSIMKSFGNLLDEPFSNYSASLNSISQAKLPIFQDSKPSKIILSHKSCLQPLASPALLNVRARSMFDTGARADLITFFLTHENSNFSASDLIEIGYSKRNLAEILEELCLSRICDKFLLRNQQRYHLVMNDPLVKILGPIPEYTPSWRMIFEILLQLRDCIDRTTTGSESTRAVKLCNFLIIHLTTLKRLNLTAPLWQDDFHAYLTSFNTWLIDIASKLAQGSFADKSSLKLK